MTESNTTSFGDGIVTLARDDEGVVGEVRMHWPERRNALSLRMIAALAEAFHSAGESELRGIVLAADGPVFSAGHDFSDMAGSDIALLRRLFESCTDMMNLIQSIPQPVIAMVHGLATAAGCQLVATCDLAVASEQAGFAIPGGKGGLFCHTPSVALARNIGRKRLFEMAFTGDVIDAATALDWGLVNRVVPHDTLESATRALLGRAIRGSAFSKAIGKTVLYRQIGLNQPDAYRVAAAEMAAAATSHDAQEGMASFLEKREPKWQNR